MGKYLEDRELNSVLENYFDNYTLELSQDNILKEGILSDVGSKVSAKLEEARKKEQERRKKEQEKLLTKFKEAIKNNKYKYYVVNAVCTYNDGVYRYTTFTLYGSDIKAFTKKDKGFFRAWKKDMKAKKIMTHTGYYMERLDEIPSEVRKYIL